jgi:hypothetical protein
MAAGIIVASGLFTILEVTLRQTARTQSRIDATQRGRLVLETINNEMHSACVENKVVPIIKASTGDSVSFWSQYGNAVELTPVKRTITFDATAGTLSESTYTATGEAPHWTASATPATTRTLLTDVARSGSTPVFQYFSADPVYASQGNLGGGTGNLTENESEATTDVLITLVVKPTEVSGQDNALTPNTVTNTVNLRLTPTPNPGTPNQNFRPCE